MAAGPSQGSMIAAWYSKKARLSSEMWYLVPKASGTIMAMACGRERPPRVSSSSTLSKIAESLPAGVDDGQQAGQVLPEQRGGQAGLPGAHVVHVAPQGVDLAVVGREAERLGQEPGWGGVGAVALVHDGQRAFEIRFAQVRVEGQELRGHEHALVHDGPAGQGRDVEALRAPARGQGLFFQAAAQHVQPALGRLARPGRPAAG